MPVILGDGSTTLVSAYTAVVYWNEDWLPIEIVATDGAPLIGMTLLRDSRITIAVRDGGAVNIVSLY